MLDAFVDYVVRPDGRRWTVCRRSFDSATIWLQSTRLSTHLIREDALAEVQRIENGRW